MVRRGGVQRDDDDDVVRLTPPPLLRWEGTSQRVVLRKAWAHLSPLENKKV